MPRSILHAVTVIAVAACTPGPERPPADSAAPQQVREVRSAGGVPSATALRLTPTGIGPVRAGMTLAEASAALAGALIAPEGIDSTACAYVVWRGGPAGTRVMIEQGRIARIDVDSGAVDTDAGARIGDSEERIQSLYSGHVAVTPHKYTPGAHYLTVTPAAPADSAYRLIFETESGRVVRYRAGRRPAVEYVERCG